jgi:hypothetical protein
VASPGSGGASPYLRRGSLLDRYTVPMTLPKRREQGFRRNKLTLILCSPWGVTLLSGAKWEARFGRSFALLNTHLLRPTKGAEDQETCGDADAGVCDVE